MGLSEKEKLEDMIIAILLNKCEIRYSEQGKILHFTLEKRKLNIFIDYLQRFNLKSQFYFDPVKLEGYVLPSYMLERMLRVWVKENKVHVIDPSTLRLNALFIWIGLFAKKTLNGVHIHTNLERELQNTLSHFFELNFKTNLIPGSLMKIKPFSPVVLRAIQSNRPIEEGMELTYLLPYREKAALKEMVSEWEKENSHYAF